MRIIQREDKLIIENRDFLYGILFFGAVLIIGVLGFSTESTNSIGAMIFGIMMILVALFIPATNIVLDYKKKEIYLITISITRIVYSKQAYSVKNIKKIYAEIDAKSVFSMHRYRIVMSDKNNQTSTLYKVASARGGYVLAVNGLSLGYKNTERVAKALDDKVQELKK